jgi:CheY-like chemotaxis protein
MTRQVFVIDDSELDLFYARIVLERLQPAVQVHTFDSAADALQALQVAPAPPDLILLDINMPGMNGFDFLAAYEQAIAAGLAAAPVAIVSSSPDAPDRDRAFALCAGVRLHRQAAGRAERGRHPGTPAGLTASDRPPPCLPPGAPLPSSPCWRWGARRRRRGPTTPR